jgi:hypothetical protein
MARDLSAARYGGNSWLTEGAPTSLSAEDQGHLAALERKFQLIRDRTTGVVKGFSTGFYLYGAGGVGKSYAVLDTLRKLQANFKVFNSRITARGLFDSLEHLPDAVHVVEDTEQITRDGSAQGVLRSALWGQRGAGNSGPMVRKVTWNAHNAGGSFIFTGGIIMTANRPLQALPELNAVRTRIVVMQLEASDLELRALMRGVARRGYEHGGRVLDAAKCTQVCEYLIEHSLELVQE